MIVSVWMASKFLSGMYFWEEGNALDGPRLNLHPVINSSTFNAALSNLGTLISEVLLHFKGKIE